jgi:hypothetical protein
MLIFLIDFLLFFLFSHNLALTHNHPNGRKKGGLASEAENNNN